MNLPIRRGGSVKGIIVRGCAFFFLSKKKKEEEKKNTEPSMCELLQKANNEMLHAFGNILPFYYHYCGHYLSSTWPLYN